MTPEHRVRVLRALADDPRTPDGERAATRAALRIHEARARVVDEPTVVPPPAPNPAPTRVAHEPSEPPLLVHHPSWNGYDWGGEWYLCVGGMATWTGRGEWSVVTRRREEEDYLGGRSTWYAKPDLVDVTLEIRGNVIALLDLLRDGRVRVLLDHEHVLHLIDAHVRGYSLGARNVVTLDLAGYRSSPTFKTASERPALQPPRPLALDAAPGP